MAFVGSGLFSAVRPAAAAVDRRRVCRPAPRMVKEAPQTVRQGGRVDVAAPLSASDWRAGQYGTWRGQSYRYCVLNEDGEGTPLVLVHGFGASAEHWRFNAPVLTKSTGSRPVYALDLLGFGLSAKPAVPEGFENYGVDVWGTQVADFIRDVVKRPAVVVGNSIGAYTSLYAGAKNPDVVRGIVVVNLAGPTSDDVETRKKRKPAGLVTRIATYFGFLLLRRAQRVQTILNQVYTDDKSSVDDDLVQFILQAAFTPGAFEVFFRSTVGGKPGAPVDVLLREVDESVQVGAIWGENDPWCTKAIGLRTKDILPRLQLEFLKAGHCPHDESPEEFNLAMARFLETNQL